jgi:hypothetical protein
MTTQNKAVTCYLPRDIEDFITGYCNEYGITRKDKEGNIYPSLGTGIIELLKLLAYNPELVGSPLLDAVPSKFSEDAIEKKIDEILEKKLSNHLPDNVPSIEFVKDRLDNWVLAIDGDIKDINQKIRDKSLQVDHQIASIKSRLDNMEPLLKLQREASIADHSPLPTGEPSPDEPNAIDYLAGGETLATDDQNAIEDSEKKIPLQNTLIGSPIGIVETVETDSSIETGTGAIETAIETAIGDEPAIEVPSAKKKGLTDSELARHLGIDKSNITRWKQKGEPTQKYRDKWELRGRLWHEKD